MDRRRFLQTVAASAAAAKTLSAAAQKATHTSAVSTSLGTVAADAADVGGHILVCTFVHGGENWKVYEDLRTRDGVITFVSSAGRARVLTKSAEASFASDGPQHLGLDIKDIGMAGPDLLADKLLAQGDPNEDEVRSAAPPMHSFHPTTPNRELPAELGDVCRDTRVQRHDAGVSQRQHAHLSPCAVLQGAYAGTSEPAV